MNNIERARKRADGHCEAFIWIESTGVWTRCGLGPIEIHHALTKARGGRILDDIGEDYHLIALCPRCHRLADGGEARSRGLVIDGSVVSGTHGPVYRGPDEYLSHKYSGEPG
jgi:hypothetical protein